MTQQCVLVACIGNIFRGDDAFGVEVAKRLIVRDLPEEVRVVDFGIRGLDLAFALLDGADLTIFVDAASRGGAPGTIYTIEPDLNELWSSDAPVVIETHELHPLNVLRMVKSMGGEFNRILLVGCEPATLGSDEDGEIGLSEPVRAAVDEAIEVIESIVTKFLNQNATPGLTPT